MKERVVYETPWASKIRVLSPNDRCALVLPRSSPLLLLLLLAQRASRDCDQSTLQHDASPDPAEEDGGDASNGARRRQGAGGSGCRP